MTIKKRLNDGRMQKGARGYFGDNYATVSGQVYENLQKEEPTFNDKLTLVGFDLPEGIQADNVTPDVATP